MDYKIFFRSRGSVKPLGWSGLIAVACICNVLELLAYLCWSAYATGSAVWIRNLIDALMTTMVVLIAVIGKLLSPGVLKHVPGQVRRFISLGSPFVAVLLLVLSLLKAAATKQSHMVVNWIMFTVLLVAVLLLTLSRLVDAGRLGNKYVFWRRVILNICMFAELVMLVFIHDSLRERIVMTIFQAYALLCVSFGNLLIPTAIVRVVMALMRLVPHDYSGGGSDEQQHESRINLAPSLDIFYVMVLSQGILYIVSCTLEMFSFLPRRSLAHQGGFRGFQGVESVNLYYEYAMEKCMERDVVARKQISLDSFAIQAISSDSPKLQFHGVWMMHNLLHQEPSRTQLLSKLHRDASAVARLINMLEWRSPEDAAIRLFAAKVTAVLTGTFRVVSIPGAMQAFSALLDADSDGTETESLQDCLPGLALSILDSLASNSNYDFHNSCLKVSKAAEDLIPKIIRFTCYRNDGNDIQEQNTNEEAAAQKKRFLMESALQLLGRLSSINGKIYWCKAKARAHGTSSPADKYFSDLGVGGQVQQPKSKEVSRSYPKQPYHVVVPLRIRH